MKKLFVLLTCFCLVGCASLKLTGTAQDIAEMVIGKRIAYEIAYQNPELINDGIAFCDMILETDADINALINLALKRLREEVEKKGDKLLISDLELIMSAIKIEGGFDMEKVTNFVIGFQMGLELRK